VQKYAVANAFGHGGRGWARGRARADFVYGNVTVAGPDGREQALVAAPS
jgi:hypothetical protein